MSSNILMPALSPTMEEGKLAKWHVKEGDAVKAGDILAEIETDKATMEFEAIDEGRIGRILVPEGAEGVKVNAPIAVLLAEGEDANALPSGNIPEVMKAIREALVPAPAPKPEKVSAQPAPASRAPERAVAPPAATPVLPTNGNRLFASPLAKRIARQKGIDISSLQGSGPHGRIVKADVDAARPGATRATLPPPLEREGALQAPKGGEPPPVGVSAGITPLPDARLFYKEGEYEAVPHDSMRRTIARRLTSAKALIPHYYLTVDCDIGALMEVRARLNARSPKDGPDAYKLSINDFVIKAAASALMKHPDVNASWSDTALLRHKHADIGIAVDLNPGLITPIISHAETRGLLEITREARSLAERAKQQKLKPQEF